MIPPPPQGKLCLRTQTGMSFEGGNMRESVMRSVWLGVSVTMILALAGCGGGGPSDAEVAAAVRSVLAGAIGHAPTAQNPDALPPAERQTVMAVNVSVGDKKPNGDGSFDAMVHLSCQPPGGGQPGGGQPGAGQSVDFTQAFNVLQSGQGWALSAIGGKALAKMAAPCLAGPAGG
jgi:hypothetical protein